jgi:hypothetical protein
MNRQKIVFETIDNYFFIKELTADGLRKTDIRVCFLVNFILPVLVYNAFQIGNLTLIRLALSLNCTELY